MKYKYYKTWILAATTAAMLMHSGPAEAQNVFLVVDRETGAVNAVSNGNVNVDGYSISSAAGRLNPETWNSLVDQGLTDWAEAKPRPEVISELNWTGSSELAKGQPTSLGNPYTGGPVLPRDEDIGFRYSTPEGSLNDGTVRYSGASQLPTISVDRGTGQVGLSNPAGFAITGYSIGSSDGSLKPDVFNGLSDQGLEGWTEANPLGNLISELNLSGELAFGSDSFGLGNIYGGGDLSFQYATPDGEFSDGVVDFTGATPDLVLQVDLVSGAGTIQNLSPLAGPFEVVGYSVFSETGSLSVEGWNSLSDQGVADWMESNPRPDAIAELNPTSSMVFDNGTSVSIGNILDGTDDLVFQYGTPDGFAFGTVEYTLNLGSTGPSCAEISAGRIGGDINGDGEVAFSDFLVLSSNFGETNAGYDDGDVDCSGDVGFSDFLILSANFGATAGASAASVPEPCMSVLGAFAVLGLLAVRTRR